MTASFLAGEATFPSITATVAEVLGELPPRPLRGLDDALAADRAARAATRRRAAASHR
jgi:hypothetical protein